MALDERLQRTIYHGAPRPDLAPSQHDLIQLLTTLQDNVTALQANLTALTTTVVALSSDVAGLLEAP